MTLTIRSTTAAIAILALLATPTLAQSLPTVDDTHKDVEAAFGVLPDFMEKYPDAGISGAWHVMKNFEMADTALDAKTKALISVAVAAQIPCRYCIWMDTETAKTLGATDEEVREAVTMAAMTRHWSTVLNGFQIDFEAFQKELGGE